MLTMANLLAHSESVPIAVRAALQAAYAGPPGLRLGLLESAARILHREVGVDCRDALELVDLETAECAC